MVDRWRAVFQIRQDVRFEKQKQLSIVVEPPGAQQGAELPRALHDQIVYAILHAKLRIKVDAQNLKVATHVVALCYDMEALLSRIEGHQIAVAPLMQFPLARQ